MAREYLGSPQEQATKRTPTTSAKLGRKGDLELFTYRPPLFLESTVISLSSVTRRPAHDYGGILTVKESKRRRFRLVPLHPSALRPLEEYSAKRTKRFPAASFFFVNRCGDRLAYTTVRITFRKLTLRLGWVKNGKRPRLHDLRHSFACRVLFKWRSRQAAQEDRIDWLSHYLGHERVSDTYWYLSATPELFAATAKRFKPPTRKSFAR